MRCFNDAVFLIWSSTWNVCCQNQARIFEKGLKEDKISDLILHAKDIQKYHVCIVRLCILDSNLVDDCYTHNFRTYVFSHMISEKWKKI